MPPSLACEVVVLLTEFTHPFGDSVAPSLHIPSGVALLPEFTHPFRGSVATKFTLPFGSSVAT